MPDLALIDVILVTYNNEDSIAACLGSIKNSFGEHLGAIHVVDNNSSDGTVEILEGKKNEIHLHSEEENKGFAVGVNCGIGFSRAPFVFLLNPDAELDETNRWDLLLERMARDDRAAMIGIKVRGENGQTQASAYRFPTIPRLILEASGSNEFLKRFFGERPLPQKSFQTDYVQGSAVLIRRSVWDQLGGFDEDYFLYHEEMDFCYRAKKAGYTVWYDPVCSILHHGGWRVPPGREFFYYTGLLRFFKKHDPARLKQARRWILRLARVRRKRLRGKEDEESRLSRAEFEKLLSEHQGDLL